VRSLAALLLAACGDFSTHPPHILEPCARVETKLVTAADGCLLLVSANADAAHPDVLFKRPESEKCGGAEVLCLQPGESAWVMERVRPSPEPVWWPVDVACSLPECAPHP
jgi:hypothetical protein